MSASALARAIAVPRNRLTGIINGKRAITADTALRLGIYFGTSAEFWLSLQASLRPQARPPRDRRAPPPRDHPPRGLISERDDSLDQTDPRTLEESCYAGIARTDHVFYDREPRAKCPL